MGSGMADDDPMDVPAMIEKLNAALSLQYRSVLEQMLVAGTLRGVQWQPFEPLLLSYANDELADARRIAQKIVAIGGRPTTETPSFTLPESSEEALTQLIEHECETTAAFHAAIEDTGQEPRSEAMEHRLEHLIMRKQEQVDTLRRALDLVEE